MAISAHADDSEAYALQAFEDWVESAQGRGLGLTKAESIEIYRYQWGQYVQYLMKQGLNLFLANSELIEQFLFEKARLVRDSKRAQHKDVLNQYEQLSRYRRLLERVYENIILKKPEKISANPARLDPLVSKAWTSAERRDLRGFVTEVECEVLEGFLTFVASQIANFNRTLQEMINNRPYVITALIVGAGLKTCEVTALSVRDLNLKEGYFSATSEDSGMTRIILLKERSYLARLLEAWMADWNIHVAPLVPDTTLVFPSVLRSGQPHDTQLSPTTVQRNVCSVFAQALEHPNSALQMHRDQALEEFLKRDSVINPQLIRNSYIAKLFKTGNRTDQVTEHMGFLVEVTAERIWLSWMKWRAVYDKPGFLKWVMNNNWDPRLHTSCQNALGQSFTEDQLHNFAKQSK